MHGAAKTADQEVFEWKNAYGTGPIHSDQAMYTAEAGFDMSRKDLSKILKNQYGITPLRGAVTYAKSYLEVYAHLEVPPKFKIPHFTKFSGNDGASTVKHGSRYLAQLGIASRAEHMKI